jgi:hypothetical protein
MPLGHPVNCSCATCILKTSRRLAKQGIIRRWKDPKTGQMMNALTKRGEKYADNPDKRWKW